MESQQFILLGPPGVGVKDHAIALAERRQVPCISMEALLRQAAAQGIPTGSEVPSHVETDVPVPDALVIKLLRQRLEQPDAMLKGWVLEGFPQTLSQAQALDQWLTSVGQAAVTVAYLKGMTGLLVSRLSRQEWKGQSTSDIRQRLADYQKAIDPVLEYYQAQSQLHTLNGSLSFKEVAYELSQLGQTATGTARTIQDEAELDSLLASEPLLVVDGMAAWCGPCKLVAPLIDQLADAYSGRASVTKMDLGVNQQISQRFGLKGMPVVMFFKDGELRETLTGVKPYETYSATVSRFLEAS